MHRVSELGIAAHWRYKEGSKADRDYDAKLAWVRQLMDWQRDVADATEFVEGLKLDLFQDQVFVFTPKGDVKDLPAGSTPLDFAYRIHTDVGHSCIGAKVNNRLVPLDYKLKNGDIVEIVTTKAVHGPSRDWLKIVATSHAKEKIRQWFKRQEREENIVHGRDALERELRRLARSSIEKLGPDRIAEMAEQYRYPSVEDFFAAIGYGAVSAQQVVTRLEIVDDAAEKVLPQVAPPPPARTDGVRVKGVGDLMIRFARCCSPIPGDPDRWLHHPRSWRDRAPAHLSDGGQREGGRPADRGRVGAERPADIPDRDSHRGLRPARAAVRDNQRHRREQGQHHVGQRACQCRPHGDPSGHAAGLVSGAAGQGPPAHRAAPRRPPGYPRDVLDRVHLAAQRSCLI